ALTNQANFATHDANARSRAVPYAGLNPILASNPGLAQNDVVVGYMSNPSDPTFPFTAYGTNSTNAVWVRVQRTSSQNGQAPLFFAKALGIDQVAMQAQATAALLSNIAGFQAPSDGGNLGMLPLALDQQSWNSLIAG